MPTSSELAQYRLLMQLQNQQNRIPFPTITPTSGGAGVNFLQGLGGGLGYGIQRRQQGNSVEQLNQMMQAQAAAEQQAAVDQYNLQRQGFTELGYNPALANFPKETQNAYIAQTGQPIVSGLNIKNLEPLLQNLSPELANQIRIEVLAGKNPHALQSVQQVNQAAGEGAAASDQVYNDKIRNIQALSLALPRDKKTGNYTPEAYRTLQNAYGQTFGGGAPITAADLQKESLGVQDAALGVASKQLGNTSAALGNTKAAIGNTEIQRLQALENQYQNVTLPAIRARVDLTDPQKIQVAASQRTLLGLPEGAPVSAFFNPGKVDKSSTLSGFNTTSQEATTQAMDAAKPQQPSFYQSAIAPALQSFGNWAKQDPGAKPQTPQMINVPSSYFNPNPQAVMGGGMQGLSPQSFRQPSFMLGR